MTPSFHLHTCVLLASTVLCACDRGDSPASHAGAQPGRTTPIVFTVNFPLQSFVSEIGETLVEIEMPKLDGHHADDFRPTSEEIIKIQEADLILLNGADFSPWTAHASLPRSKTVVTAAAFKSEWLESTHGHGTDHDHQHGPDGEGIHHEGHWASFTWLDPAHARAQALAVGAALERLLPQDAGAVQERTRALGEKLDPLVAQAQRLKSLSLPTVLAAEPHYQYLAAACGLDLLDADWHWEEPEPEAGMESLEKLVEASGARYILVPEEPTLERKGILTRLQLEPVIVDPLGNPPPDDDTTSFVERMGRNLNALEVLAQRQPTG